MTRYFTADQHLMSSKIMKVQRRPFNSLEEQTEAFIEQWNNQVTTVDTVEILGDFSNLIDYKFLVSVLERLKGTINFTIGNYDNIELMKELLRDGYINELNILGKTIYINGVLTHLTHYPLDLGPRIDIINVHGHLHSRSSMYPNQFNISVDSPLLSYKTPFYLVSEEQITEVFNEYKPVIESWYDNFNKHVYCSDLLR